MSFDDDREPTPLQRYALSAGRVRPEMMIWLLENAARLDGRGVDDLEGPFRALMGQLVDVPLTIEGHIRGEVVAWRLGRSPKTLREHIAGGKYSDMPCAAVVDVLTAEDCYWGLKALGAHAHAAMFSLRVQRAIRRPRPVYDGGVYVGDSRSTAVYSWAVDLPHEHVYCALDEMVDSPSRGGTFRPVEARAEALARYPWAGAFLSVAEALPRRACPGWGCRGCGRPGCEGGVNV
jgi:hypothetical protein